MRWLLQAQDLTFCQFNACTAPPPSLATVAHAITSQPGSLKGVHTCVIEVLRAARSPAPFLFPFRPKRPERTVTHDPEWVWHWMHAD